MIQCLLNVLEVRDDTILYLLGKLHVFHGCIRRVNLTLELGRFLVQIGNDKGHITKDVGINNGTDSNCTRHKRNLKCASWQNIIASEKKHSMVECDKVLVGQAGLIEI